MAPNSELIRFSPTPAFTARMLALPALNDAVNRAMDVFDSTKTRNDAMGAALRAAEVSMRVAASGALPLATPLVNTVGGWGVVDDWACRGLDRVVKVAPIIKKPTKEIVTTTRERVLMAVAGDGHKPESLTEAVTTRANQAVIVAEFVTNSKGGVAVLSAADQFLASAHEIVDNYLPAMKGDRQGQGVPRGGISIKVTSLVNKTRQRLYRSAYILIRPPTDRSLDGPISISMLISFGRRTAEDILSELRREPRDGESQNAVVSLTRSALKLTEQYTDQVRIFVEKQVTASKTVDSQAISQFLQNLMKASTDMTSNATVYVQGGFSGVLKTFSNVLNNASEYRVYLEDQLRKAMSDYENRERATRAAAAAAAWRQKNNMERTVSPPLSPERYYDASSNTGTVKRKTHAWQKIMGKQ